jgi:hypothetical protein
MDPLSALGAAAAITQLTGNGLSLVRTLERFSRHAKLARTEFDQFTTQVRNFSNTVGTARATLFRHCRQDPRSPVLTYISANHVIDGLNKDAEWVCQRLWDAKTLVKDIDQGWTVWRKLKWSFNRTSILSLSSEMESTKASLSLLVNTVQLEVAILILKNQEQGYRSSQEVDALRTEM